MRLRNLLVSTLFLVGAACSGGSGDPANCTAPNVQAMWKCGTTFNFGADFNYCGTAQASTNMDAVTSHLVASCEELDEGTVAQCYGGHAGDCATAAGQKAARTACNPPPNASPSAARQACLDPCFSTYETCRNKCEKSSWTGCLDCTAACSETKLTCVRSCPSP